MPRIIKPNFVIQSDDVVIIPDTLKDPVAPKSAGKISDESDNSDLEDSLEQDGEGLGEQDEQPEISEQERMLEETKAQCEQMISEATAEAEKLREQAKQQGFMQAHGEMCGRSDILIKEIQDTLDEMQQAQNSYFKHYKKELKYLALDIAEKIMQKMISENDTVLGDMVKQVMSTIKNADWVTVEVSDKLVNLVDKLKDEFTADLRNIDIVSVDKSKDSVVVKTSDGIIDASVSAQLDNIKELFHTMDKDSKQ